MRIIKAVFFDWFNTLARYNPPRYQLHSKACHEFGIELSPDVVKRGVLTADRYFFEENTRSSVEKRSPEEKAALYYRYQEIVLSEAGLELPRETILSVVKRAHELFEGVTFVLFDDVLSTMKMLKERKLVLGLLTNANREVISVYRQLGLEPYLDFIVTSEEAGGDKPRPPIFLMALERAGADASAVVHVGDQYGIDVVGARGVGISPILIDRDDLYPEVTDCPRISTLPQLVDYI
ncbi:HAD family hydrolase [Chloroflexota bacterium]